MMLALVRYADEQGVAFPSIGTLCAATKLGRTKAIESLAEGEARGLFVRRSQARGKGLGSNHYELPFEPPMEGLQGNRRLVRHANQSATRTSPSRELGSSPPALALVRQANGGSPPREPYLLTDLPSVTTQGTDQPRKRAQRSPTKGTQKPRRAAEVPLPEDWKPSKAHEAYAAKHRLILELEADAMRGWAKGKVQTSWDGTFTTRLANQAKWNRERGGTFVPQTGGTVVQGDRSWIEEETAAEAAGG